MAEVCVSRNLDTTAGVLGMEPWSVPRFVVDTTVNSIGDGTLTQQTTLPGKLMIDISTSWVSDSPLDTMILIRITRARREVVTSNPNYVQIRDRYTVGIDEPAQVPDVSNTFQSAYGGSVDRGTGPGGTPFFGQHWYWADPCVSEDWGGPVPAGSTINVRYRCYVWTPPPWSNNASNNVPLHEARVFNTRLQLMAFPTQDTEVVIG